MARIRSIKPEFQNSQSMGRVSRDARLTFIELWPQCDDAGRIRANSRMLASVLFPYDADAPNLIDAWLSELENEGCIVRYSVDHNEYLQIIHWNHQKIDHPQPSKLPPPPTKKRTKTKRIVREKPTNVREASPVVRALSRIKEGIKEGIKESVEGAPANAVASQPKPKIGTRWLSDQEVPESWIEDARKQFRELGRAPPDLQIEAIKFANYWASKPGRDGMKLDWKKTWINWTLTSKGNENGRPGRPSAHENFAAGALLAGADFDAKYGNGN